MTADECPLTELPPAQCACPNHRGGTAPGEPELLQADGLSFEALYPGTCEGCGRPIARQDWITRVADEPGKYAHYPECAR